MKIIVYEHVSGGGYTGQALPGGVLAEGYAMLQSFTEDLKAAGHHVTVLLDERISKLNPPLKADFIIPVSQPQEPTLFLLGLARVNDAAYIIAPETASTLQKIVKTIESTGKTSLNCSSDAIAEVADKAKLTETLQKNGYITPKTALFNINDSLKYIKESINCKLSYPLVFKPVDGAGCSGVSLIKDEDRIQDAIEKLKKEADSKKFIVQEFVEGESVSVSLLSNGSKAVAFSLNKQNITLAEPTGESTYNGGYTPLNHPNQDHIFVLSEKIVETLPGLRGYIGVDLIINQKGLYLVDVNPRLTVSYVGVRSIVNFNLAQAIIKAVTHQHLPQKTPAKAYSYYTKIKTPNSTLQTYQKTADLSVIISPPFPLSNQTNSYTLISCTKIIQAEAVDSLEEAKKNICSIIG